MVTASPGRRAGKELHHDQSPADHASQAAARRSADRQSPRNHNAFPACGVSRLLLADSPGVVL
jgi:hypothetical protein